MFKSITISDWLLIIVTGFGPVAAVQVQKWIERARERRSRRLSIFQVLMATRASRAASTDHVQALNLIELFYDSKNSKEKAVRAAWQIYYDFLAQTVPPDMNENEAKTYNEKGVDFLVNLLDAMGKVLGYDFSRVALKRGGYYPQGHADENSGRAFIRDGLVRVLSGKQAIPMEVVKFPVSDTAVDMQIQTQAALLKTLSGGQPLRVQMESSPQDKEATVQIEGDKVR